ncbi:hypothetical protein ACFQAS_13390 [Halopenitus salinus]|uniref:DUF8159 domain-containing protein n=1 Tax=Halopenitus salinus TaxID=1198295 RepID=A0ABD5UZD1_9EURY
MTMDADALAAELRSYGISVEDLSVDEDALRVTYMTAFPGDTVHHPEIGRACNALIDLQEADRWEPTRVEATVERAPGDVLGRWHVEPEWFERLASYELSETEFSTRVVETIDHASETSTAEDAP